MVTPGGEEFMNRSSPFFPVWSQRIDVDVHKINVVNLKILKGGRIEDEPYTLFTPSRLVWKTARASWSMSKP